MHLPTAYPIQGHKGSWSLSQAAWGPRRGHTPARMPAPHTAHTPWVIQRCQLSWLYVFGLSEDSARQKGNMWFSWIESRGGIQTHTLEAWGSIAAHWAKFCPCHSSSTMWFWQILAMIWWWPCVLLWTISIMLRNTLKLQDELLF